MKTLVILLALVSHASALTCHGEDPCKACSDCSRCKWCAKQGQSCGTMRAQTGAESRDRDRKREEIKAKAKAEGESLPVKAMRSLWRALVR